ncbi:hypothetical protein IV102_35590 [bacterium]|nr:hypothetical protein [bacterium]
MAIEIEFVSVISLKSWVTQHYPGGLDAYADHAPTRYLEDAHLTRVGFMSTWEAEDWFEQCKLDPAFCVILCTDSEVPEWLACGPYQGRGAVWKASEPPGDLVAFEVLMLRGLADFLSQPGWVEKAISGAQAQIAPPSLEPMFDPTHAVVACTRGDARVEFEIVQKMGLVALELPRPRKYLASDLALTRDLRESFIRLGAPC